MLYSKESNCEPLADLPLKSRRICLRDIDLTGDLSFNNSVHASLWKNDVYSVIKNMKTI